MKKEIMINELKSWVKLISVAVITAVFINTTIIANATVPTGSMESTVMTGDRVLGFRLAYLFSDPERGDIIMFKFPDDESKNYLKRIIGLPGEQVEIIDGEVYINGSEEPLQENYLNVVPTGSYGPFDVPADSYFVMGDNRNTSYDSRWWRNKFVSRDQIIAKAIIDYYPSIHLLDE